MTAPRIEDERGRKIGEDEYTEHWSLDGHTYIQVPKWVITQAHQAGIDKALEICERHKMAFSAFDSKRLRYEKQARNKALDDTIKALQDKK